MTRTIQLLPPLTINQIAAGEVIEHPASVVKELVENSVDAGATHITIDIQDGGFGQIVLSDDGCGMSPEDAVLCLERHATSKIKSADDLFKLSTMGFRGEALASIAAISKLELLTSEQGDVATHIHVEGGKVLRVLPGARAKGTTLTIRSLFYNVPARRSFQKTSAVSSAEITKAVTQLALAHPHVGFTLIQQKRTLFTIKASFTLKQRAELLLDVAFVESTQQICIDSPYVQGTGLVCLPSVHRHNRSGQYLFINHRPVFCPAVSYAIKDAYGTRLSADRYPLYLLHLTLPPASVDVNVHPQKKEVRLREEKALKDALHQAVNQALDGSVKHDPLPFTFTPTSISTSFTLPFATTPTSSFVCQESVVQEDILLPFVIIGLHQNLLLVDSSTLHVPLFESFGSKMLGIDLIAAERRVRYDALSAQKHTPLATQGLLIPLSFSCTLDEAERLEALMPLLEELGLGMSSAGKRGFLIHEIPSFLETTQIHDLLVEILASPSVDLDSQKRRIALATLFSSSCAATPHTLESARLLATQLFKSSNPRHCPKGQPICYALRQEPV